MRLGASGASFVMPVPRPNREAFLEGHIRAFRFFGGVPRTIWYDNLGLAVKLIGPKSQRTEQEAFTAFRAHYLFDAHYCTPGEEGAHEKGLVESLVGFARRHAFVPVPRAEDEDDLTKKLLAFCEKDLNRPFRPGEPTIREVLREERSRLLPLPPRDFIQARTTLVKVTSQALCHFERCRYSVPDHLVGETLTLHAYWDRVVMAHREKVVAEHKRLYQPGQECLQMEHYIRILQGKPGAVAHARVFSSLTGPYKVFRNAVLARGEGREFARILPLARIYGETTVTEALKTCIERGIFSSEAVKECCRRAVEPELPVLSGDYPALIPFSADPATYDVLLEGARP